MGRLTAWNRVHNGPFSGRLVLDTLYGTGAGAYDLYCLARERGGTYRLLRKSGRGGTFRWSDQSLPGQFSVTDAGFWAKPWTEPTTRRPPDLLLGRGNNNWLYQYQDDTWSLLDNGVQFPEGGLFVGSDVVGRGLDNQMWRGTWNSDRNHFTWAALGGNIRGRPTLVGAGGSHAAARGTDGALWVHDGRHLGSLDGGLASEPTAIDSGNSSNQRPPFNGVVVRATDQRLWLRPATTTTLRDGSERLQWRDWQALSEVQVGGDPSIAPMAGRRLYCLVRSSGGHLLCRPYDQGQWQDWQDWLGNIVGQPVGVVVDWDQPRATLLHVLAIGSDGALWERAYRFSADELL